MACPSPRVWICGSQFLRHIRHRVVADEMFLGQSRECSYGHREVMDLQLGLFFLLILVANPMCDARDLPSANLSGTIVRISSFM
ncbi:hypothetical protein AKJ16_DCAP04958 [Drosera capensis]